MKICTASPQDVINDMELAADTLKINCHKLGYHCTYAVNADSTKLKGHIKNSDETLSFLVRFIKAGSGLLYKKSDHYRLDVIESEGSYEPIESSNPQNAVQKLIFAVQRNTATACADEETDGYDADVKINKRNKPLRPTPVPLDGFTDDTTINYTNGENWSSASTDLKFEAIDLGYGYGKCLKLELDDTIKTGCFISIFKKKSGYSVTVSDQGQYERETSRNNYVFDKQSKAKRYALDLGKWINYVYGRAEEVKCPKPIDYI